MILAIDVDYKDDVALIAGITFDHWTDPMESEIYKSHFNGINEYIPGEFYRRELPCILKLLEEHDLSPDCIVIDGLVFLDGKSEPGLGKHLYDALNKKIVVIGVAKKPYKGIAQECAVYRGYSQKPLYVTVAGISLEEAKGNIESMHGKHRVPVLLKKVDQACREME